jgi:protein phosphatase
VALSLRDGCATMAHVGDSRLYRLRHGRLEQLTVDHSLYAELAAAGAADLPAKKDFHLANVITRALGMPEPVRADLRREPLQDGDTFLLCSDGVNEKLDDAMLADLLAADDVEEGCRRLVAAAYQHGGRDNITAVVVRAHAR